MSIHRIYSSSCRGRKYRTYGGSWMGASNGIWPVIFFQYCTKRYFSVRVSVDRFLGGLGRLARRGAGACNAFGPSGHSRMRLAAAKRSRGAAADRMISTARSTCESNTVSRNSESSLCKAERPPRIAGDALGKGAEILMTCSLWRHGMSFHISRRTNLEIAGCPNRGAWRRARHIRSPHAPAPRGKNVRASSDWRWLSPRPRPPLRSIGVVVRSQP